MPRLLPHPFAPGFLGFRQGKRFRVNHHVGIGGSSHHIDKQVVVAAGHRWANRRAVAPRELAGGRWISRDPSGESSGLNLYAYCSDNPVNFSDLLGLRDWTDHAEEASEGIADASTAALEAIAGVAAFTTSGVDGPLGLAGAILAIDAAVYTGDRAIFHLVDALSSDTPANDKAAAEDDKAPDSLAGELGQILGGDPGQTVAEILSGIKDLLTSDKALEGLKSFADTLSAILKAAQEANGEKNGATAQTKQHCIDSPPLTPYSIPKPWQM